MAVTALSVPEGPASPPPLLLASLVCCVEASAASRSAFADVAAASRPSAPATKSDTCGFVVGHTRIRAGVMYVRERARTVHSIAYQEVHHAKRIRRRVQNMMQGASTKKKWTIHYHNKEPERRPTLKKMIEFAS